MMNDHMREEEQIDSVNMPISVYCEIVGITKKTFNNWKKSGKVEVNSRKEVVIPVGKILIITKEVQNEVNKYITEKKLMTKAIVQMEKSLVGIKKKLNLGLQK